MEDKKEQKNFHSIVNTILLSVISIFGVYSLIILNNVNAKINELKIQQAIYNERQLSESSRTNKLEIRVDRLESKVNSELTYLDKEKKHNVQ